MSDFAKYKGIIPAFYACYEEDGTVSSARTKALARYFVEKGVKGVYVNGSSGECIYLSVEERKQILEAVMEEAKGKLTVICHVACNNTADSAALAAHAEQLGADAIASIPPIYFRLPEHAIAAYWNDISAAAPKTDFIIYNIPQLAGVSLTMPLFKKMRENPRVIGVKNSSMPVQDIQMFKAEGGENCVVFNGPDEQFVAGRAIGADGGIGGTYGAMPDLFLKMDALLSEGKAQEAQALQYAVNEIIYKMCSAHGSMYAVIKGVLRKNEDLDIGGVRAPLANLIPEDEAVVEEAAKMIREAREKFL
ncbi:MAG: dihydrodipicolinate synthase family protein [Lachnospiraceae bacterium]|nr:dihydrodipicolinate synthase family protein [Lachnospiraceae bacterium]